MAKYSKEMEQFRSGVSMKFSGEKMQRPRVPLGDPAPKSSSSSKIAKEDDDDDNAADDDDDDKEILYTNVPLNMKNVDKKYYDLIGKQF